MKSLLGSVSTLTAVPFYGSLGFMEKRRIDIALDGKLLLYQAMLMCREAPTTKTGKTKKRDLVIVCDRANVQSDQSIVFPLQNMGKASTVY